MSTAYDVDILVVGAGPVGLALACQLQARGVCVKLIEQLPEAIIQTKAAGIWTRTTEVLDMMGVADAFVRAGIKGHGGNIHAEGRRIVHFSLDEIDSPYNYVLLLPQDQTERLLTEHLHSLHGAIERGRKLTGLEQDESSVTATVESAEGSQSKLRCRYLVGTDGSHSAVRKQLGLDFPGRAEGHLWLVGDFRMDGPIPQDEITVYLHIDGPVAIFPLGDHRVRLATEVSGPCDPDVQPDLDTVRSIFAARGINGFTLSEGHHINYFRIHERQVDRYQVGRAFLAGDAAHVHSPLGGQGMNTGLQDAHNLAWKLAGVVKGELRPEILESYHAERHPVAADVIRATSFGTEMITLRSPLATHLRNRFMSVMINLPVVQSKLRGAASELAINYRKSNLSKEPKGRSYAWMFGAGIQAGDRAPDAAIYRPGQSDPTTLFARFRDRRFHLLLFGGVAHLDPNWSALLEITNWIDSRHPETVQVSILVHGSELPRVLEGRAHIFLDSTGDAHKRYAGADESLYLIRPDGYVAHRSQPADLDQLEEYLESILVIKGDC